MYGDTQRISDIGNRSKTRSDEEILIRKKFQKPIEDKFKINVKKKNPQSANRVGKKKSKTVPYTTFAPK